MNPTGPAFRRDPPQRHLRQRLPPGKKILKYSISACIVASSYAHVDEVIGDGGSKVKFCITPLITKVASL
jgi:hypothetical protein